ncbi:MAG TPA: 2-hydroxymuconate tautomerase [Candidatus Dormibacteraeota bacterium]|nr:2-hydroxymuconate tautomerase [Candidatus Dormibacteraeota bacterium]
MPLVQISMREGRTREQKRRLVRLVTEAMVEAVGARRERVTVVIHELPAEDWATGGLLLADEEGGRC